jgi:hypothetical protein
MQDFVKKLRSSSDKREKALHDYLAKSVLPGLLESVPTRKKAEERAARLESVPKRSGRLHVSMIVHTLVYYNLLGTEQTRNRVLKQWWLRNMRAERMTHQSMACWCRT